MTALDERDARLKRGDELWKQLCAGLDSHLHEPVGPNTDWTGHEVYAHFARWQQQTLDAVRAILAGRQPRNVEGTEEEINNRWRAEDRASDTATVRQQCLDTRVELRTLMAGLSEEQWSIWGRQSFDDIDGSHYTHHIAALGKP